MAEPEGWTIDALAHDAGIPTSTLRLYQSKGLLPPPRLVGRVGWYGEGHRARLRLIGRLQEQGYSLAAIGHLLAAWESGRALVDVLGVEPTVPLELTPAELAAVFEGVELTPDVLASATWLGLVEPGDDGRVRVPNPTFLRLGAEIARLGIPPAEVLEEYAHLRSATESIADRFMGLFDRHVLDDGAVPPERLAEVAQTFERLRTLASQILDAVLRDVLAERAEARIAAEADRLGRRRPVRRRGR